MGILQEPIRVGKHVLAGRLVMPPMATGFSDGGYVTDLLISHYVKRSAGQCLGLVTVEHSFVCPEGKVAFVRLTKVCDAAIVIILDSQ